jgi:adenosylcobyric acid synthase
VRFDDGRRDGAMSPDGRVCGTYVHGLFAADKARAAWLAALGALPAPLSYEATVENALDSLAEHIERHVDVGRLLTLAQ